jgi:citrate synthase
MAEWLDRKSALAALSVRRQTLYAYVSRGRIGMMPDPTDPRRSLYRADDIADLTSRRARGRRIARIAAGAIAWGDPVIATSISTVEHGKLIYRGEDAATWAMTATLEETAQLLWQSKEAVVFPAIGRGTSDPFQTLAGLVAASHPMLGRTTGRLHRDAAIVVGHLAASLGATAHNEPIHQRVATGWHLSAAAADRIRQALVLLADHELNASTFATRVAASTGASIAASLLAGMSTLSGPQHGGAGAALLALMEETGQIGATAAVARWLARGQPVPGFGHSLYPEGDARAAMLLDGLPADPLYVRLQQSVHEAVGTLPNIDFALAVLTRMFNLPTHAPLSLFMLGRSIGWVAHAIEQITAGELIRPRAHYQGSAQQTAKAENRQRRPGEATRSAC